MTLTKIDLARSIHRKTGFSIRKSIETVETMLELIKSSLENGDDVLISGFGKFCVKEKNARKGRNPATGDGMMIRPRKVVTFKCSGMLKGRLNGKE
jgi:integration host factor subunit alpha